MGKEAKLCFIGHVLSENRNGLIVDMDLTGASGTAEREAALGMIDGAIPGRRHRTLAADAGYHTRAFVEDLRDRGITPHVAMRKYAAIDGRTTGVAGYEKSQRCRRIAEGINGWVKGVGRMAKTRFKGVMRSKSALMMYGAAYNLLRISKLLAPA
ncbi:MAG: transposase [Myxococcota bacterium]